MVRSKKQSAVLVRGGDEAVGGGAFYAAEPARRALRVLDTTMNTAEAPVAKAKEKRPTKPKTAAQLYAENECEAMIVQSGLHGNQSKLAIKTCKDDALAAFKKGEVEQKVVDKFEEKEKAERAKYEKQIDQWNEQHPDEILVINKNGNAVLSQADPEKQKKKEAKAAHKAAMKKLRAPGTTAELKGISDRAAAKLKKLQAKKKKQQTKGKKEEEGEDDDEDMDISDGESEDVEEDESEDESEPELSDDEEEEKKEEPVKSKGKGAETSKGAHKKTAAPETSKAGKKKDKAPEPLTGGKKKNVAPQKEKDEKVEAPSRKRKAQAVADEQEETEEASGTKKKRGKTAATKSKEPATEAEEEPEPKVAKGKATAKKADVKKADTKKTATSEKPSKKPAEKPAGKETRASKRAQQEVAEEAAQPQSNKKKPAKAKQGDKKAGAKAAGGTDDDAKPVQKSRLSRVKKTQNGKKNLGPTMPKPSPEKSNSAYTGNYDVPSDDE